jgi:hypothetical protein
MGPWSYERSLLFTAQARWIRNTCASSAVGLSSKSLQAFCTVEILVKRRPRRMAWRYLPDQMEPWMKFARIVFGFAGVWGVLVLTPLYFLYDLVGKHDPPALTHPQFYYGFLSLGLAWQAAFLVIAADPLRFRPVMIPALLEKWGYVVTLIVLTLQRRLGSEQLAIGIPDGLLGILFFIAFVKTRNRTFQA